MRFISPRIRLGGIFVLIKNILVVAASLSVLAGALTYGVLIGKYELFPYTHLRHVYNEFYNQYFTPDEKNPHALVAPYASIATNLLALRKDIFNYQNPSALAGSGGGLTKVFGSVIGVDRVGHFFHYLEGGKILYLDLLVPNNSASLETYLSEKLDVDDDWRARHIRKYFRVIGITAKEYEESAHIFVTYNYWHDEERAKSIRVSRIVLQDFKRFLAGKEYTAANSWELIYESAPLIPFSEKIGTNWEVPFNTNHSGGGMIIDRDDNLIVGIGDHNYDGIYSPDLPQDDSSSYGKLIAINLDTLDSRHIAKGVRNPQGLLLDSNENVWFIDQGPKGGDELNLLESGANYGWPQVTYGTQYSENSWPLSKAQGRHDGFKGPTFVWVPSIAISGGIEVKSSPAQWDGDLLISSMKARQLQRVRIVDRRVVVVEPIDLGDRARDILQMDDGTILVWTDSASLIELSPIEETAAELDIFADLATDTLKSEKAREFISICRECHSFKPGDFNTNTLPLWHIVGREIASTGYRGYSEALKAHRGDWTEDNLKSFLRDTSKFAPGTTMPNIGMNDEETLNMVVAYLKRLQ
jgi:cytochrome c2